jgi:hypothetical protein
MPRGVCPDCDPPPGSGRCAQCGGTGQHLAGPCVMCDGTGKCQTCEGTGFPSSYALSDLLPDWLTRWFQRNPK